jgi:hypothetical protein
LGADTPIADLDRGGGIGSGGWKANFFQCRLNPSATENPLDPPNDLDTRASMLFLGHVYSMLDGCPGGART